MNRYFGGWAVRFGRQDRQKPSTFSDIVQFAPVLGNTLRGVAQAHRKARIRVFDVYPMHDLDKLRVSMVYHRFIPTDAGVDADEFMRLYVGEESPSKAPDGVGRVTRSLEDRAAELATRRDLDRELAIWKGAPRDPDPTEGDPWYDADTAYEFYRVRAIARVADGFDESVWFAGVGFHDDVDARFREAIDAHVVSIEGKLVHTPVPHPTVTYTMPGVMTLLSLGRHEIPEGVPEFERRFITLERWQGNSWTPPVGQPEPETPPAPGRIRIVPDDYHVPYAGTAGDGRRFFLSTELFKVTGPGAITAFVGVFLWTAEGEFDELRVDAIARETNGPPGQAMPASSAEGIVAARLAELGDYRLEPIEVAPFEAVHDGVTFGFIPREYDGEWSVDICPGDFISYRAPWDGEEYDT